MPLMLGIPLWAWITGGVVGGAIVADQAGDAAQQAGDAAEKGANLAKWVVIGGGLYVSYQALRAAKVLK